MPLLPGPSPCPGAVRASPGPGACVCAPWRPTATLLCCPITTEVGPSPGPGATNPSPSPGPGAVWPDRGGG